MPNGGITPDCVHCRWVKMDEKFRNPFCTVHEIKLPIPIRIFCANFAVPREDNDKDWLADQLEENGEAVNSLKLGEMYIWISLALKKDGNGGHRFIHQYLAPVAEVNDWTFDKTIDCMRSLFEALKADFEAQGYEVDFGE